MRFFPLATVDGKEPVFADDFDPSGKYGRKHAGIDIYADKGTPVLAVDDGELRHAEEKNAGHVLYLYVPDFQHATHFHFYGHLDHYSDVVPITWQVPLPKVKAGDVLGAVGHTGKTDINHCHFETHETGGGVIDPFPALSAAEHVAMAMNVSTPTAQKAKALSAPLAAKALSVAYTQKHGAPCPPAALYLPLAQAIGEGTCGDTYAGTNNWGSMHATQGFAFSHQGDSGYGMFAHLDSGYSGFYVARLELRPSPLSGARAFLDRIENALPVTPPQTAGDIAEIHGVVIGGLTPQDVTDYCSLLYVTGYFTGSHDDITPLGDRREKYELGTWTSDDAANIADYAALLTQTLASAKAAVGAMASEPMDPGTITVGPPFAPLAHRLTPNRPPHTMQHARELLGKNADNPPAGAISLHDAEQAHEGVWLFGAQPGTLVPAGTTSPDPSNDTIPAKPSRLVQIAADVAAIAFASAVGVLGGVVIDRYVLPTPKKRRSAT